MSAYLFWAGAASLILAAAAMVVAVVALASGNLELAIPGGTTLTSAAVQVVLALWALTFLAAAAVFGRIAVSRLTVRRALRRQGPKGMILITPETVRELAGVLLREELGLHRFRVHIHPMGEGLALRVALHLPPGEEVPVLAERLQSLLAQEVSAKTGLEVPEVRMVVVGTARPSRHR
ncbi:MAG: hypothetical protein BIP78_0435 [Candidatus Bipolaricaulis sibiricus]|uniref:Alkaline shock response membrane anchor protein AmaP n=1 Tax=Bipolaricaulis sibiricus TaxID=2501609 RepID=A0A410FTB1_BIPS1|nr:MAG: hypothetical protein BIP78_0435 [Candidatus Bipolaricaulis sibiricus]